MLDSVSGAEVFEKPGRLKAAWSTPFNEIVCELVMRRAGETLMAEPVPLLAARAVAAAGIRKR